MSFTFRVRKYKNSKEGSIYTYRKLKSGKVIERKTGFSLPDASSWSKSKQKSLSRKDHLINKSLIELKSRLEEAYIISLDQQHIIDSKWLTEVIEDRYRERTDTAEKNPYFVVFVEELLTTHYNGKPSAMTIKRFLTGWRRFEVELGRRVLCSEMNRRVVGLYKNFLASPMNTYSSTYQNKTFSQMLTICDKAKEAGITIPDDYKVVKRPSRIDTPIVVLTNDEMTAIRQLDLSNQSGLANARFWFLLQSTTALRISDLLNLEYDNIENKGGKYFTHRIQQKTGKPVSVVIFDKWVEDQLNRKLFPYKISKQKYRAHIKEICRRAGIVNPIKAMGQIKLRKGEYRKQLISRPKWEFISSHSARRFCATFLYEKEIHPTKIIKQTGHSSIPALMTYIGKIDKEYEVGSSIYNALF
jgi:integrase